MKDGVVKKNDLSKEDFRAFKGLSTLSKWRTLDRSQIEFVCDFYGYMLFSKRK